MPSLRARVKGSSAARIRITPKTGKARPNCPTTKSEPAGFTSSEENMPPATVSKIPAPAIAAEKMRLTAPMTQREPPKIAGRQGAGRRRRMIHSAARMPAMAAARTVPVCHNPKPCRSVARMVQVITVI